ncbi:seryl-tRNA synthetase [Candidatus Termititenax aidoneus]|uniref:Serine--tRNA ligase n=1 Tax=Termititenax aidoneus TaxID=2218524 RepID=A0A388TAC2_TERA1|nr:seryl-tRNA synthetase [Candidatus Termititenax aidoneus]
MLDQKLIRENPAAVKAALSKRNFDLALLDDFLAADQKWKTAQTELDNLRARLKAASKTKPTPEIIAANKKLSEEIKQKEKDAAALEEEQKMKLLFIPNLPDATTPDGRSAADNPEIHRWGEPEQKDFTVLAHDEIGVKLGILNFDEAAKISGARFVVYHGAGARLERALINLMLDTHAQSGYQEVMPPALVNAKAMTGTGQLPKFQEDLFACDKGDGLYLIPTAEVPVTNLHREEILDGARLPLKYAAYTPCFRREAGSYGKDTRGIIRQHQFNKVELVKFTRPEDSAAELEKLTADAEKILQMLKLPYRAVALSAGDLGFSSSKTYDLEVWFPAQNTYREISSCSNYKDYQARRAGIRFRREAGAKPEFAHTLNGSGLAVGRTLAAILENYQNADGSVTVPEVLRPYLGGLAKIE